MRTIRMKVGTTVISVWAMPVEEFKERIEPVDREMEY
jgi:hypothetical protein